MERRPEVVADDCLLARGQLAIDKLLDRLVSFVLDEGLKRPFDFGAILDCELQGDLASLNTIDLNEVLCNEFGH